MQAAQEADTQLTHAPKKGARTERTGGTATWLSVALAMSATAAPSPLPAGAPGGCDCGHDRRHGVHSLPQQPWPRRASPPVLTQSRRRHGSLCGQWSPGRAPHRSTSPDGRSGRRCRRSTTTPATGSGPCRRGRQGCCLQPRRHRHLHLHVPSHTISFPSVRAATALTRGFTRDTTSTSVLSVLNYGLRHAAGRPKPPPRLEQTAADDRHVQQRANRKACEGGPDATGAAATPPPPLPLVISGESWPHIATAPIPWLGREHAQGPWLSTVGNDNGPRRYLQPHHKAPLTPIGPHQPHPATSGPSPASTNAA